METCMRCGCVRCQCQRWPGFNIKLWDGGPRRVDLEKVDALVIAMSEALKPEAPLFMLTAALRYFVETGG